MEETLRTQLIINCRDIKKDAGAAPSVKSDNMPYLVSTIIPALLYHPGYTFVCPHDTVGKSLITEIVQQIDKKTHTFSKSTIINGIKPLEVIQSIANVTIDAGWGNDTMKKYGLNPAPGNYIMNIFETAASFIDPATRPKPVNPASIFFLEGNNPQVHRLANVGLNVILQISLADPPATSQETLLTFNITPIEENTIFSFSTQFTLDRLGSLYEKQGGNWKKVEIGDPRVTDINGVPIYKYIAGNKTKNEFINGIISSSISSSIATKQETALYTILKEIGDTFQVLYLFYIISTIIKITYFSKQYQLDNTTSLSVDMPFLARAITTNTPCLASNNSSGTIFFT